MKQGSRAIPVCAAALALGSCAAIFGERDPGGGAPEAAREPAVAMKRIPEWIRPSTRDLERSEALRAAIGFVEGGEYVRGAVLLQRVRAEPGAGPEVAALHAWCLLEAASTVEAERVAREGIAAHGADAPSLNYSLAVIHELAQRPAEAYAAYLLVLRADPGDPVLARACARTALADGRPADALPHLDRLVSAAAPDPEAQRMRAAALAGVGRLDDAMQIYEGLARDYPQDPVLLVQMGAAAFELARMSGRAEHRQRAGDLLARVVELDPQHAGAHAMLGATLAAGGDIGGAEAALRRTLEIEPNRLDTGFLLAQMLAERGRREAAREVLMELLRQPLPGEAVAEIQRRLLALEAE